VIHERDEDLELTDGERFVESDCVHVVLPVVQ
jgi:hypothetical protein